MVLEALEAPNDSITVIHMGGFTLNQGKGEDCVPIMTNYSGSPVDGARWKNNTGSV